MRRRIVLHELIGIVLQKFLNAHQRRDVRELQGKIKFHKDYDYKALRARNS